MIITVYILIQLGYFFIKVILRDVSDNDVILINSLAMIILKNKILFVMVKTISK